MQWFIRNHKDWFLCYKEETREIYNKIKKHIHDDQLLARKFIRTTGKYLYPFNKSTSMVCTPIDYRNDVKMFNTQVEPNELKCILLMIR